MDTFLMFDINFFSVVLLLMILVTLQFKQELISSSGRIFKRLLFVNIFMLIMEVASWQFDMLPGRFNWYMNYMTNMIFAWCSPLISCIWLSYIDYHMFESFDRLRKHWFFLQPMIINTIFIIINFFTPFIFSVSPENVYSREPFMWLIIVLNFSIIFYAWFNAYRYREHINREIVIAMLIYVIVPAIAAVLQVQLYGVFIIWPVMAITIVVTYIFLDTISTSKDYLTGLLSRNRVDAYVDYLIDKGDSFGLAMIDLDGFKEINDEHGHINGDKALKIFADILKGSIDNARIIGRYGGDEFVVVFDTISDVEISSCRNRIKDELNTVNKTLPFDIKFSMGYQLWHPEEEMTYEILLNKADQNMYKNKLS